MGKVKKYKTIIGTFISSDKGQRFFNFAYSIGAAIVIWGALFKILHLPGGNALLSIGMGTEVMMFILTAFDRPPRTYKWEDVFPVLNTEDPDDRPEFGGGGGGGSVIIGGGAGLPAGEGGAAAGGTVIVGGGVIGGGVVGGGGVIGGDGAPVQPQGPGYVMPTAPVVAQTDASAATQQYVDQINSMAAEMERLRETTASLNLVSETLLAAYQAITQHSSEINESATGYVQQMQSLNLNISGLNTIYEIQLKSISSQLDAIDRVNRGIKDIRDMYEKSASQSTRYCEETEKMARYMQQLNQVYEKMLTAMTINMYNPMMPQQPQQPIQPEQPQQD